MTTIILVILGVLLAAAAVLFVIYYGGDAFGNGHIEAEAGRLVGEGAQMEAALELYYRQEGHYPTSDDPVAELIAAGYLDYQPLGTRTTEADRWSINYDAGMILARLGTTESEESSSICLKARQQLNLPVANTSTGIYRCDGTDSPGGKLAGREPCCIGEVGVGGGAVARDVFATATLCNNLASMPVNTDAQKAAYIAAAGACVQQRTTLTNQRFTSLADIGDPQFDYAATGGGNPTVEEHTNGNIFFRYDVDNQAQCDILGYRPNGSFSTTMVDQCYWGYRVPRRYYRNITSTYRPAQVAFLESEADKIAASIAQKGYLGTDMSEFLSAYAGYDPDMKGQTSSPWVISEVNNYVHIQAQVPHEGVCSWYRSSMGYSGNKYDGGLQYPSYCWYSSSMGHRFQRNVTTPFRTAQHNGLKREAGKVFDSLMASQYAGLDLEQFRSSGGYTANMKGFTTAKWKLASSTSGPISLTIDFPTSGFCGWYRSSFTNDGNLYNGRVASAEWCGRYNQYSPYYYQFNIGEQYRAKQKAIIERERKRLRKEIVDRGGAYAIHVQPDFEGALPNNGELTVRSGKTYYRAPVDEGLCKYLVDERAAAGTAPYYNFYDFHYRPVTCHNNGGLKAYLDLTVD